MSAFLGKFAKVRGLSRTKTDLLFCGERISGYEISSGPYSGTKTVNNEAHNDCIVNDYCSLELVSILEQILMIYEQLHP